MGAGVNTGLWGFAEAGVGVLYVWAAKLVLPRQKLATQFAWANDFSATSVKLIGLAEALDSSHARMTASVFGVTPTGTRLAAVED